ncbi:MAG: PD-(D/E)XK nuclease domain-containing protein [Candidatus Contendobacter sp.]|nr:hypothetical protein [Gammaproteobacteria bacterium]MCC8994405.1 PD-(D/E)XK nuclease domain-containing protein [Candidatus Contendobacter sp.]
MIIARQPSAVIPKANWLEQIKTQGYFQRYAGQPVTLIGIDFSPKERNLSGFAWERG